MRIFLKILAFCVLISVVAFCCKKSERPQSLTSKMGGMRSWHGASVLYRGPTQRSTNIAGSFPLIIINDQTIVAPENLYYSQYSDNDTLYLYSQNDSTITFSTNSHGNGYVSITYYYIRNVIDYTFATLTSNSGQYVNLSSP